MSYRHLLTHELRFVAAGFALCFFSSFGQTFFLGVFGGAIRSEFDLSDDQSGLIYTLATLASGCTILWAGRGVDRYDLRQYTSAVCLGLSAAALLMSWAPHIVVLFFAYFALRLTGQGLMGHIAMTSMARYISAHRARAISLAAVGFAAGEAVFPRLAIAALQRFSWQEIWFGIGVFSLLLILPLLRFLLRNHSLRHDAYLAALAAPGEPIDAEAASPSVPAARQWTRAEVLRDPGFYLIMPAAIAPPMIVTGMFFHAVRIAEMQEWGMEWYGACFAGYAAAQFATGILAGPLVDRIGAARLFPLLQVPMAAGLGILLFAKGPAVCLPYLILAGTTVGAYGTVTAAMWAEIYGVRHLGSIRTLVTVLMVFATALSPFGMGLMLSAGATVPVVGTVWISYILASTVLVFLGVRRQRRLRCLEDSGRLIQGQHGLAGVENAD